MLPSMAMSNNDESGSLLVEGLVEGRTARCFSNFSIFIP
jgi:hypothetical protein